ncbi:MAG TPA: PrsW family glutamic-type intramembrane protease [Chitinophagales bacterium]|nr:PrsW family intramembrane metalloprotease [Chitinophagales bacterium]HMX03827.1 PrsW family glutamic-type intramembrane protease [Chitinophagales bacterium]HMZ89208.1 PrsW family glutamic-type intramembrane protease [Chitinophagales bacterium]HNA57563.1 PrsW family glutamic-type intramembrane protease [Chitinophagales bacterium]HNE46968.1 PrsW family glutamic-type intramembrane protease [Chitinophagales bacterium]
MDFQTLALLALAVGPAVAIMFFFYSKDKNDREPFGVLLVSFLTGCFSVLPAIILEKALPHVVPGAQGESLISIAIFTFIIVAGSEEFSKYLFLRYYAYRKPSFNEPFDGIVYAIMVGMGFATIENLLYVFGADTLGASWGTAGIRAVTAIPAHATFAAIMGYFIGLAKFNRSHERRLMFYGFIGAVILHGFYDFFLFQNYKEGLVIGALISLIAGIIFSIKAMRLHRANPFAIKPAAAQTKQHSDAETFDSPNKPN